MAAVSMNIGFLIVGTLLGRKDSMKVLHANCRWCVKSSFLCGLVGP